VRDKGEQREIERGERQSEEVGLGRERSQGGGKVRKTWRNRRSEGRMRGYSRRGGNRREEKERRGDKKREYEEG
jgi:hypothetical protein